MRCFFVVGPDGTWRASDELGVTLGEGTWARSPRHVVTAQITGASSRPSANEKRRSEMLARAVVSIVHAMVAHNS